MQAIYIFAREQLLDLEDRCAAAYHITSRPPLLVHTIGDSL